MSNIVKFAQLTKEPNVLHGISTRSFGTMKKDDGTIHHANMMKFAKTAGVKHMVVCMDQIHSGHVSVVENNRELVISQVDGLVTKNKDLALAVVTADCIPILFYDPVHEAIGVAHAGSRGLLKNIIGNTVKALKTNYGTDPKDLLVGVGPCIEQRCYTVGHDLIKLYKTAFSHYNSVYIEGNGTFFLNIRGVAVQDLQHEGIPKGNIEVSQLCTKCNPETLYSYRGGDGSGRFASVISLK